MTRCRKKLACRRPAECLCPSGCCDCCPRDECGEPDPCAPPAPACGGLVSSVLGHLWPGCGQFDDAYSGCDDGEERAGRLACALAELRRCVVPASRSARLLVGFALARAILWFFDIEVFIMPI